MSVDTALITRIRKILARTEEAGCTSAEAEAAYALASSLMARHNLDMAQIEQASGLDGEGWTEAMFYEAGRASGVVDVVAGVCLDFFFVKHYQTQRRDANGKIRVTQMFWLMCGNR